MWLALLSPALAVTWVVDAAGGRDFTSIQEAIDNAADGDTILVKDGLYVESAFPGATDGRTTYGALLFIEKSLTLVGESTDGVVITTDLDGSHPRTGALYLGPGLTDVRVAQLTFVHDVPGTETSWGGTHAYTAIGHYGGYNSISGYALLQNLVFVLDVDRVKTVTYTNSSGFAVEMQNLTVDFGASRAGNLAYNNYVSPSTVLRNSVVYNTGCGWVYFGSGTSSPQFASEYSLFYGCSSAPAGDGNLSDDPLFVDRAGGDYHLSSSSPAVDAGDPATIYYDADATRNDMGAFGGVLSMDPFDWDQDGYSPDGSQGGAADCDDANGLISPRAAEIWYDGVDQNCDGADDYDADGDGQQAETWGEDCDDTDPTIYSGATEIELDGVDQDCDGYDAGADSDGDGLLDTDEAYLFGTDPFDDDSDDDGLLDGEELTLGTDPLDDDSDDDGLLDGEELTEGTDPLDADSDDDGLSDGAEVIEHGTDPLSADTDSDGLSDAEEVNDAGTDPVTADTDGDGLSDGEEVNAHGTDPLSPDTDSGGVPDGEELANGTDPLDPADDAAGDDTGLDVGDKGSCSCASRPGSAGFACLGLLGALLLRRRRR